MIGQTLGHYSILAKIGEGGMGEVYRARDERLGRDVALKILPPGTAADSSDRLRRFQREAQAIASLNHPNIVTLYSIEENRGIPFLTMELVEGETLDRLVEPEGLPLKRVLELAIPLCEALVAAHEKGVVHRDLKPTNVMVTRERRVKVLDFGLAKLFLPSSAQQTAALPEKLTAAGRVLGTPSYMSPEQVTGQNVDHRSDIFSLGVILFELVGGRRPFLGRHAVEIMHAVVHDALPALPGVGTEVEDILQRCLEKSPVQRFSSAADVLHALQRLEDAGARPAQPPHVDADARDAFGRDDWEEACRRLRSLAAQRDLTGPELEILAWSSAWISEFDECVRLLEKAYATYVDQGDAEAAGRTALGLVNGHTEWESSAVARGWMKRAERHLRGLPECLEHGRLFRRKTADALAQCDLESAAAWNQKCMDVADRLDDEELRTEALHDQGRILVLQGKIEEGRDLIDEAMATAVSGAVHTHTLGALYCRTLTICSAIADFGRAREWTQAARRWCGPHRASSFPGICRVHGAETMRHQGQWGEAESLVRAACDWFLEHGPPSHTGHAFVELGELLLRKGELDDAEEAFRQAHGFGADPVPGLPLLRLAQGRPQEARQVMERALAECGEDRLRRGRLLAALVEIALATEDSARTETAARELAAIAADYPCPAFQAQADLARGRVLLEKGDVEASTPVLREAWQAFHRAGFPYDAARARTQLARAYLQGGNVADARLQLEAASRTFAELGAEPDRAQVVAWMESLA
jgi:tetratricopeptide (TPR) repeat protein